MTIEQPPRDDEECMQDDDFIFAPYCECEIEYDEEELASNICKACGKEIS